MTTREQRIRDFMYWLDMWGYTHEHRVLYFLYMMGAWEHAQEYMKSLTLRQWSEYITHS